HSHCRGRRDPINYREDASSQTGLHLRVGEGDQELTILKAHLLLIERLVCWRGDYGLSRIRIWRLSSENVCLAVRKGDTFGFFWLRIPDQFIELADHARLILVDIEHDGI